MLLKKLMTYIELKYLVIPKPPVLMDGRKKIACIGDSITYGAGVNGRTEETWEYFLEQMLGEDWQVLNYGINGRTLLPTGDYPFVKEKNYRYSQQAAADIYLIMLGTNDSKPYNWDAEQYRKEYSHFIHAYRNLPNHPEIILMTAPACFEDAAAGVVLFDINKDIVANEVYTTITEAGKIHGLRVIDLHAYTAEHQEWFMDGVHPNKLGNERIASYIYGKLQEG